MSLRIIKMDEWQREKRKRESEGNKAAKKEVRTQGKEMRE